MLPGRPQRSLNERDTPHLACPAVLVPEGPQNTPGNAELIPLDRNRAWHRTRLSEATDTYIPGWTDGGTTC